MNKIDAMMVIENHRIRSPRKLYAAAEALAAYDIVTFDGDIRRLLTRAKESERLAEAAILVLTRKDGTAEFTCIYCKTRMVAYQQVTYPVCPLCLAHNPKTQRASRVAGIASPIHKDISK
jgi:hypothetical protein